jgi:hypothetical protein
LRGRRSGGGKESQRGEEEAGVMRDA